MKDTPGTVVMRAATLALLGLCALMGLTSCGGGGDTATLLTAGKISDRPGMLGGELKPEFIPTAPADMQPAALATALTLGAAPALGTVPANRANWYDVNLLTGHTYVVTLQPTLADEDSDLYVLRPQAAYLAALGNSRRGHDGDSLATPDWLAVTPVEVGIHQVAAVGWSPTAASDPNDFRLEADELQPVVIGGPAQTGTVTPSDSRFYSFDAAAGVLYSVALRSNTGDADLFVYGATSAALRGSATGGVDDLVRFTAYAAGRHVVRVYGASASSFSLTVSTGNLTNLFFLHHSTGQGLIDGGNMRGTVTTYNTGHGTHFEFWDHGYNGDGLTNATGVHTGTSYNVPNDNTDPDGLHYLWTSPNADAVAARNAILSHHQVIAFKSCFPASAITDAEMLQNYKNWYVAIRNFCDTRPDRLFVVMSTPPLHRLATNTTEATNARSFANWLKSPAYLTGHRNVLCFDLFDKLARASDGTSTANRLRYDFESSHADQDSHPNAAGNAAVGPVLANYLCEQARVYNTTP